MAPRPRAIAGLAAGAPQQLVASTGQLLAIRALVAAGSLKGASRRLAIKPSALKARLALLRYRNRLTNVQLAYMLGRLERGRLEELERHDIERP